MALVLKTPPCGVAGLASFSAMEMSGDFSHTFRLCASVIVAITRTTGLAVTRDGDRLTLHGDRQEVSLGWPFTSTIWLFSEEAVQIVAAIKAALRRLAVVAFNANLDVSARAFCSSSSSSSSSSSRSSCCHHDGFNVEISAMIEVVKAYTTGGGVWPGTGPRTVRPSIVGGDKAQPMLHLKDSGKGGRVVLRDLLGDPEGMMLRSKSTFSSTRRKLVLCAQPAAEEAPPPPRPEETSMAIGNSMMAETSVPATIVSRVDLLCLHGGGGSTVCSPEVAKRSLTTNESVKYCGTEQEQRPQGAATLSHNKTHEEPCDRDRSKGAAGSLADHSSSAVDAVVVAAPTRRNRRFGATPTPTPTATATTTSAPASGSRSAPSYPMGLRWFGLSWSRVGKERRPSHAIRRNTSLGDAPVIAVAQTQTHAPVNPSSSSSSTVSPHDPVSPSSPPRQRSAREVGRGQVGAAAAGVIVKPGAGEWGGGASLTTQQQRQQRRSPELSFAETLVHSGKEEEGDKVEKSSLMVATVDATSRESSAAAVAPPPATAPGSPSPSTADYSASKSERPSPPTTAGTAAAVASSCSDVSLSPAASPRERGRVPSSPRGRPSSCSPGGRSSPIRSAGSSSPSLSCASGSPARRRGSAGGSSSPRARGRSNALKDRSAIARSLYRSPPPPDLPRACYYGIGGLSDSGAFWDGGNKPRRTSSSSSSSHLFPHAAVNILLSRSKEALAKAKTDTPPGVSSSSSSSSSSSPFSSSALEQATAAAAATTAAADAAAAAAAEARKKARRVTWCPIVLAREDAAAFIKPMVKRYAEVEVEESRLAHAEDETRKFVERRSDERAERAERERGGAPVCPPAPRWGPFFTLMAGFETWPGRGIRLWPDDYCTPPPPPPGRVISLGDVVRGMCRSTC